MQGRVQNRLNRAEIAITITTATKDVRSVAQDAATGLLSSDVKGWHLAPGVLGKVMPPDRIAASIVNSATNSQD